MLTVLWNERELSFFTCFCCRAVLPNVHYRLSAQFGHLVCLIFKILLFCREVIDWNTEILSFDGEEVRYCYPQYGTPHCVQA